MKLSKKPETFFFFEFFIEFLEYTADFHHFEEKYEPHSFSICEIIDSQRSGYFNA